MIVGVVLGDLLGDTDGAVVGMLESIIVGVALGDLLGDVDGAEVGMSESMTVGAVLGTNEGVTDGFLVGELLGSKDGNADRSLGVLVGGGVTGWGAKVGHPK